MPPSSGHPLKGGCTTTLFSLGPKPQVCPRTVLQRRPGRAQQVGRRGMDSSTDGNGVGQPARAKEKARDALLGKTKRKGEGRLQTCQQPGQGEPRLLAPSHSHSFHKRRPNLRTSSQGRGPPCSPGEVSSGLRRESLFSRTGVTWGANLWGSEDENPNRRSEAVNKHACYGAGQQEHWGYDPDLLSLSAR